MAKFATNASDPSGGKIWKRIIKHHHMAHWQVETFYLHSIWNQLDERFRRYGWKCNFFHLERPLVANLEIGISPKSVGIVLSGWPMGVPKYRKNANEIVPVIAQTPTVCGRGGGGGGRAKTIIPPKCYNYPLNRASVLVILAWGCVLQHFVEIFVLNFQ